MRTLKIALTIVVITVTSNKLCHAVKPSPVDLKGKLTTLKQSLGNLKAKLGLLKEKLGTLKTKLLNKPKKTEIFAGTSGTWIPLETKAFGNIGIKIFHQADNTKQIQDLAIEFYTWEHIQDMHAFILKNLTHLGKNNLITMWNKIPCTDFIYSSKHIGAYEIKDADLSSVLLHIYEELDTKKIQYTDKSYLIMDNFASDYTFRKKVSSDGWNKDINEFVLSKMNTFLKMDKDKKEYFDQLVLKIGHTLLLCYYMGITVEDCDMFIIFSPEHHKKSDTTAEFVNTTRIKLVDFGESRIFYRNDGKTILPIEQAWYEKAPKEDAIKNVIQNKNNAIINMAKDFGGVVPSDTIETYLGDMHDKFQNSFKLLNEFPQIKSQIKTKFEELKKIFGALKYDSDIDQILK